jgi:prolyl-tRNA editing enzyme YbaK/EbsC (Cys-tRNA(Pro) deacylase)
VSGALGRFLDAARALGLQPETRRFPQGTKTAEDAARAIGCDVGQIVKSLVFMADDRPVLALTSGSNRVDERKLAALAGADIVRRASPEEAREATGFTVGGTPPFGFPEPVRTFVDETLLTFDRVWAAAGTPDSVFPIDPAELVRSSGGDAAEFAEQGGRERWSATPPRG